MLRTWTCYLVALVTLGACGGRVAPATSNAGDPGMDATPPPRQRADATSTAKPDAAITKPDGVVEGVSQTAPCEGRLDYDIRVHAVGLEAWEGRTAWALATRNVHRDPNYAVLIRGRVVAGRIDLVCRKGITDDSGYPGVVLWIDADGNGTCEPDSDVFGIATFYGWLSDMDVRITRVGKTGRSQAAKLCQMMNGVL